MCGVPHVCLKQNGSGAREGGLQETKRAVCARTMSDDEEKERIRSRVVAILTKYDPSRLDKVDSLLARFEGREDEMFKIMKVGVILYP